VTQYNYQVSIMSENATVTIRDIMRENTAVSSFNYNYIPKHH